MPAKGYKQTPEHRANLRRAIIASLRRHRGDALQAGAKLGRKLKAKPLNGSLDSMLSELRTERFRAAERVAILEKAIAALDAVKAP